MPADDWIAGRWPDLARVEQQVENGEVGVAREGLRAWIEPGLGERGAALDDERLVQLAQRIDALGGELGLLDVQRQARELKVEARQRSLPADHPVLLRTMGNLASARARSGDLAGALDLEEHVHAAWERQVSADHPDLLSAKQNLALTRRALGDLEGSHELIEFVHAARERLLPADHPDLLGSKINLATSRYFMGDLEGARELTEYVHSAHTRLLPADDPGLLLTKQNLARMRHASGDLLGALELDEYVHAARERRLPADHPDLLTAKLNLALTREAFGDLEGGRELIEYVHAARERSLPAGHPDLLATKQNLAIVRARLGDFEGAFEMTEYVHATYERLLSADHPRLSSAKQNLAVIRAELGDFEGARELLEHVVATRDRLFPADHPDLLRAKQNLAGMRHAVGDIAGGRELDEFVHAARARLLPADHPDLLSAKQNLARARKSLGDVVGARELEEHVLAIRERLLPSDHPDLLASKVSLAATCIVLGDFARALELDEAVLAARERLLPAGDPDLLSAKQNLALSREAVGDLEGAHELLVAVLEAQSTLVAGALREPPRIARAIALRELDRVRAILNRCDSVGEPGVEAIAPTVLTTLEGLRLISTASPELARASAAAPELREVRDALAKVRREIADASEAGPRGAESLAAWRSKLFALTEERDTLQRVLRRELELHDVSVLDPPTLGSMAAGLDDECVYVGFWRYDRRVEIGAGEQGHHEVDSLVALAMTPRAEVVLVDLGPTAVVVERAERWRAALGRSIEGTRGIESEREDASNGHELEAGRALRASLLDPVLAALGEPVPKVLLVVPDDFIHLLPLDALPNDDGTRVGESLEIRTDPSVARLIRPSREREPRGTLVAFGGVDYGTSQDRAPERAVATSTLRHGAATFQPLAATKDEARSAAALFEAFVGREFALLEDDEASEAALIELAPRARYLHIATHGWFTPESEAMSMLDDLGRSPEHDLALDRAQDTIVGFLPETLCGLALAGANHGANGRMTAEELATLDLTNCELAVLSACETNVGIRRAGQGIQSLQTALHAAGAHTAITSLWKVDDQATRSLFELFYTKLWKDGLGKADALWEAKMALRDEGYAVRDWAGWVLTGDPD